MIKLNLFVVDRMGTSGKAECECKLLSIKDYKDMMWTTVAEFPGKEAIFLFSMRFLCPSKMANQVTGTKS